MTDLPHEKQYEPAKERSEPVPCLQCGRTNWSNQSLCVYCRLGWPDPGDMRGVPPDRKNAGDLELDPALQPQQSDRQPKVFRTGDNKVLRAVARDGEGRIAEDLLCVRCSYNLRSKRYGDVCPECRELVERSLQVCDLAAADPKWLHSVNAGVSMLFIGFWMFLLSPLLAMCIGFAFVLFMLVGLILITAGVWKIMRPQSAFGGKYIIHGVNERFRQIARWSCLLLPLPLLLAGVTVITIVPGKGLAFAAAGGLLAPLVLGVCGSATLQVLGDFARMMNRPHLALQCRLVGALFVLSMGGTILSLLIELASSMPTLEVVYSCFILPTAILGVYTGFLLAIISASFEKTVALAGGPLVGGDQLTTRPSGGLALALQPGQQGGQDEQ